MPEGLVDAMVTSLIALHDLKKQMVCVTAELHRFILLNPKCTAQMKLPLQTSCLSALKNSGRI